METILTHVTEMLSQLHKRLDNDAETAKAREEDFDRTLVVLEQKITQKDEIIEKLRQEMKQSREEHAGNSGAEHAVSGGASGSGVNEVDLLRTSRQDARRHKTMHKENGKFSLSSDDGYETQSGSGSIVTEPTSTSNSSHIRLKQKLHLLSEGLSEQADELGLKIRRTSALLADITDSFASCSSAHVDTKAESLLNSTQPHDISQQLQNTNEIRLKSKVVVTKENLSADGGEVVEATGHRQFDLGRCNPLLLPPLPFFTGEVLDGERLFSLWESDFSSDMCAGGIVKSDWLRYLRRFLSGGALTAYHDILSSHEDISYDEMVVRLRSRFDLVKSNTQCQKEHDTLQWCKGETVEQFGDRLLSVCRRSLRHLPQSLRDENSPTVCQNTFLRCIPKGARERIRYQLNTQMNPNMTVELKQLVAWTRRYIDDEQADKLIEQEVVVRDSVVERRKGAPLRPLHHSLPVKSSLQQTQNSSKLVNPFLKRDETEAKITQTQVEVVGRRRQPLLETPSVAGVPLAPIAYRPPHKSQIKQMKTPHVSVKTKSAALIGDAEKPSCSGVTSKVVADIERLPKVAQNALVSGGSAQTPHNTKKHQYSPLDRNTIATPITVADVMGWSQGKVPWPSC